MNSKLFLVGVVGVVIYFGSAYAQTSAPEARPQSPANVVQKDVMNGYKLTDFKDFEKKWKLITVRYRKDTGEMRFTYANDMAYETIAKGSVDYPDGSVFAKIGIKTVEDTAFPSSAVPSDTRRYQFMLKDKTKYADTEGWNYVLFDKHGVVFPEKIDVQTQACASCHRIVPERGYVFSQIMELAAFKDIYKKSSASKHFSEKIKFKKVKVAALPEKIKKEIPSFYKNVSVMDHEISKYLFQGSLDEVKPLLTEEAVSAKLPALIISADNKAFALVFIENLNIKCEQEGKEGYFVKAISTSEIQNNINYENRYCWVN
jgi:hypothetical protein